MVILNISKCLESRHNNLFETESRVVLDEGYTFKILKGQDEKLRVSYNWFFIEMSYTRSHLNYHQISHSSEQHHHSLQL